MFVILIRLPILHYIVYAVEIALLKTYKKTTESVLYVCITNCLYYTIKLKGEVVHVYAMKACMGRRGIAPLILNLGTRWRWVGNITPRPLYHQERNPVSIE